MSLDRAWNKSERNLEATSYYKPCTKYIPVLLRATSTAQSYPQYYFNYNCKPLARLGLQDMEPFKLRSIWGFWRQVSPTAGWCSRFAFQIKAILMPNAKPWLNARIFWQWQGLLGEIDCLARLGSNECCQENWFQTSAIFLIFICCKSAGWMLFVFSAWPWGLPIKYVSDVICFDFFSVYFVEEFRISRYSCQSLFCVDDFCCHCFIYIYINTLDFSFLFFNPVIHLSYNHSSSIDSLFHIPDSRPVIFWSVIFLTSLNLVLSFCGISFSSFILWCGTQANVLHLQRVDSVNVSVTLIWLCAREARDVGEFQTLLCWPREHI